jgi:hypothetical protein
MPSFITDLFSLSALSHTIYNPFQYYTLTYADILSCSFFTAVGNIAQCIFHVSHVFYSITSPFALRLWTTEKRYSICLFNGPRHPKEHCFVWRFPGFARLSSDNRSKRCRWVWRIGGMVREVNQSIWRKPYPRAALSRQIPILPARDRKRVWRLKLIHITFTDPDRTYLRGHRARFHLK